MIALGHATLVFDTLRFMGQFIRNQAQTGALSPASRRLARAMADLAQQHAHAGCTLIELGAGTGSITREIEHARFALYVAFECNSAFAQVFRSRFPDLQLHQEAVPGPASSARVGTPCVVLSSIPFRSLSQQERNAVSALAERLVAGHAGNYLVQYSYLPRPPFPLTRPELRWRRLQTIPFNFPPAFLWVLERAD